MEKYCESLQMYSENRIIEVVSGRPTEFLLTMTDERAIIKLVVKMEKENYYCDIDFWVIKLLF